ncbi:MAG: G5 domain-containing protein [Defluviitaleaceae bacterium]|nr:G5 domain-containing protein [Defluviitaleaceae bacterium]
MADKRKPYMSPPTPIKLDAPEHSEGYQPPKRRARGALPELDSLPIGMPGRSYDAPSNEKGLGVFRAAQGEARKKMPPPPPQIRPGDMPMRRKPMQKPPPPLMRRRRRAMMPRIMMPRIRVNPLYASIAAWCIAGITAVVLLIWFVSGLFVDNAFAVYLDGELVGHIPISEELTSDEFHNYAVRGLQAAYGGVVVQVNERVTIAPARISVRERGTRGDVIALLTRRFTYTVAATAIHVNGQFEALMRTPSDLEHLKHLLQSQWFNENTVSAEFIEGWEEFTYYACLDETEFWTPEDAYFSLSRTTYQYYTYIVERGDNLGLIATQFGTRLDYIMADNNLTTTNIFPGDALRVRTRLPLLGVRTFDEISTIERIDPPIETIYNDELPLAVENVIQEGRHGQQVTILRIIRENGTERSRETLEAEMLEEPVPHIIEVGRGAAVIERR